MRTSYLNAPLGNIFGKELNSPPALDLALVQPGVDVHQVLDLHALKAVRPLDGVVLQEGRVVVLGPVDGRPRQRVRSHSAVEVEGVSGVEEGGLRRRVAEVEELALVGGDHLEDDDVVAQGFRLGVGLVMAGRRPALVRAFIRGPG